MLRMGKYPTIGYLGASMVTEQPRQAGLFDASAAAEVNLILFAGGALNSPHGFDAQRSKIFDLAGTENIDGMIVSSDFLSHYVGAEKIREFCQRYHPLPIVKNEPLVDGYPTLLFDFYQGMRDLMTHLVDVHHFTKIGYINGPDQSRSIKDRFQAYQDVLREHGIPYNENLVVHGTIAPSAGAEAVRVFLDQRGLRPGVDLDAIVGFYDLIAIEALKALQRREIEIPGQIAVAGFDDDEVAISLNPRLTTVRLPFYEIGRWEVDMLVAILEGLAPPPVTSLPAALVIRRSCGCGSHPIPFLVDGIPAENLSTETLGDKREIIMARLVHDAGLENIPAFRQDITSLLDLFVAECQNDASGSSFSSLAAPLETILGRMGGIHYNLEIISGILGTLEDELLKIYQKEDARNRVQGLFQQANNIFKDFIQRLLVAEKNQATFLDNLLHELNQEMATALDVPDLAEILWNHLPKLSIPACFLSLYETDEPHSGFSRLILAYDANGRTPLGANGYRFHSKDLIPKGLYHQDRPSALVVQPIFHREEQIGFVVFETGPHYGGLYEALREQISSSLKRIQLIKKVEEARREAEEANKLKSRFLSIVTHELRAPLSMLVSLSEMLLEDPQRSRPAIPEMYRQDLEVIHSTGQHLDRLVMDILDLGRSQLGQLKIKLQSLDLGELLREVQLIGEQMAKDKHLAWRAYVPAHLPVVTADRTRLRQILINLLSNAAKFTLRGEISLLVTTNDAEVSFAVSDTGIGIPLKDQESIFDEFRQSDRTAARGYGGMGLGLAITRHLVELHSGKINCLSSGQEGSGTTFYFTIPIQLPTPMNHQDQEVILPEGNILILAEEGQSIAKLADYLERKGYSVILYPVEPSHQSVERAFNIPCNAIIIHSDPETEWSQEAMRILQTQPKSQNIPILFYTLSAEKDQGAFLDFKLLPKPLSLDAVFGLFSQHGLGEARSPEVEHTVLVVDDEADVLRNHTQLIQERLPNCRVLIAANGRQALDRMLEIRPDLVLLDMMMPEMDGFGVLEAMQTHQTLRAVPVIIMTSQVLSEDMILRMNRCVAGIMGKGLFSIEETLKKIETALAQDKRLGNEPQRIARRTMAYIHDKFTEQITRGDIASHIGVNERYLTHCFRQEIGITPMEYLNRYRVKIARQLLETERKSITEIGLEAGFSSSAHFSRVFRHTMGLSPREYLQGKSSPR